jgi:ABC-type transporter Mla subunit MlaD
MSESASSSAHDAQQVIDALRQVAASASSGQPAAVQDALNAGVAGAALLIDTVANLHRAAKRLNALLDELEDPLRQVAPHLATAVSTLDRLGDAAASLNELAKRLGPLAAFLPATRPQTARPEPQPGD